MNESQKNVGKHLWAEKGDLAYLATVALSIEKIRIAAQVRLAHLSKTRRISPDTEGILKEAVKFEAFADGRLAAHITSHPTWPWAERILGCGKENFPKVIGLIEAFGKYYDIGDPKIPLYVKRSPEHYWKIEEGKAVVKEGIFVKGIERLTTISKLWKYLGLSVDSETGEISKRRKGHKLDFNMDGRMAVYRLGVGLNRAKGIWYEGSKEDGYSRGYKGWRAKRKREAEAAGKKVISTPKGRICPNCDWEGEKKATLFCPECGERLSLKTEPAGYLYEGHLHMRALMRGMMKDFLLCLWLVWRRAEELPVAPSWIVEKGKHQPLDPQKMMDK